MLKTQKVHVKKCRPGDKIRREKIFLHIRLNKKHRKLKTFKYCVQSGRNLKRSPRSIFQYSIAMSSSEKVHACYVT